MPRSERWLRIGAGLTAALLALSCEAAPPPAARATGRPERPPPRPVASAVGPAREAPDGEYVEVLTPGARSREGLPVVIAIHGLGDDPHRFAGVLRGLEGPARIVLPRGFDAYHDGYSWFPFRRHQSIDERADAIENAERRLSRFVAKMAAASGGARKVIVTGFSQGGMLSFALSIRHPELIRHAFPVGGAVPAPLIPTSRRRDVDYPKITAFHGADDVLVPIGPTQRAVERLVALGFDATLKRYAGVGHTISSAMRRDLLSAIQTALK